MVVLLRWQLLGHQVDKIYYVSVGALAWLSAWPERWTPGTAETFLLFLPPWGAAAFALTHHWLYRRANGRVCSGDGASGPARARKQIAQAQETRRRKGAACARGHWVRRLHLDGSTVALIVGLLSFLSTQQTARAGRMERVEAQRREDRHEKLDAFQRLDEKKQKLEEELEEIKNSFAAYGTSWGEELEKVKRRANRQQRRERVIEDRDE